MTKKEKVKAIYLNKPELVNDDVGLCLYILNRHGANLSKEQEEAFRRAGNMEHWTRQCRILREQDEQIKRLVNKDTQDKRHKEFVDYKYNAKVHTAPVYEHYTDERGEEFVRIIKGDT
jgi:hypothetical protein